MTNQANKIKSDRVMGFVFFVFTGQNQSHAIVTGPQVTVHHKQAHVHRILCCCCYFEHQVSSSGCPDRGWPITECLQQSPPSRDREKYRLTQVSWASHADRLSRGTCPFFRLPHVKKMCIHSSVRLGNISTTDPFTALNNWKNVSLCWIKND